MLRKRVVSLILAAAVLLSIAIIPSAFSAVSVDEAAVSVNSASDYDLTGNVQTGNILHAFNWRVSDLVKYAPEIAAAGYSAVQISPIQTTKVTANDGSYATDWWSFYQPTDMKIGNALGTEDDLKEAVEALHSYGIKIVADVVTNHVMNCEVKSDSKKIASEVLSYVRRKNSITNLVLTSDNSRENQTQNDLGGTLPDINTSDKGYQNYVIENLIDPLIEAGVDGFRFDAAKHIETPDDSTGSDYWPTVTGEIKSKNPDAYIYGELLANGGKFSATSYTKYMNITDYSYGATVRGALSSKNASSLTNYGWSGTSKSQNVLWVESHDNFCDGVSVKLTKAQQILGWAIVGSRADAPALYLVRPKHEQLDSPGFIMYDELMGAPGASDTWKDPSVVAVNQFKNAFVGQSEKDYANGSNFFVQRGDSGMVIVCLNGAGKTTQITQTCTMQDGTYYDHVTGNTFTVSGGTLTGTVGESGVAAVYPVTTANTVPKITLSLNGKELTPESLSRYTGSTATLTVKLSGAQSGTVKVCDLPEAQLKSGENTVKLNSSIPAGKSLDITVTATNYGKTVSRTYNINKKNANETKRVYFDNSIMKWPEIYVYCKTGESASTQIADYDAYKLQPVEGSDTLYYYDVPANTNYIKFNEGYIGPQYTDKSHPDAYGRCHLFHTYDECGGYCGRTMPETVVNYGTANSKANRERGGYKLTGAMILTNLRFEDYGEYPVAALSAADVTVVDDTAPTEPHDLGGKLYLGDSDLDGEVSILDATHIQRYLVGLDTMSDDALLCSNVDGDNEVSILDATAIQRWLVGLDTAYDLGKVIRDGSDEPAEPTEAPEPTDAPVVPTEAPAIVTKPLPNKFVAVVYCEAAGTDDTSRNSEHAFNTATGTLTYEFIGPSYVFVRNFDTGVQYCTDGWSNFKNPVTLVNQNNLTSTFDKMYVPAGTYTLYLIVNDNDTCTLGYTDGEITTAPTSANNPTTVKPTTAVSGDDVTFIPGDASVANPAWFAWVSNSGSDGKWIAGKAQSGNIVFAGAAAYKNIKLARMPSGSTSGSFDTCWNNSAEVEIVKGKTLAFTGWNNKIFNVKWQ